ncbi:MAG: PQQ-binding-like beta-propeller repeat protein [Actinophytocola sp.]|nr:PQQ-binding-like beta-propeller repeat protein [Actinophytocola sp.]
MLVKIPANRKRLLGALAAVVCVAALLPVLPASAEAACAPADHEGGDWPVYGGDVSNTRSQPSERTIGPTEARELAPAWEFASADAEGSGSYTGTPVIAGGCLFVGSSTGWVFALNADTGELVWKTKLAQGINNSVTVDGDQVFALTGLRAAALDRATGQLQWESEFLDEQPGSDIYGAPAVYRYPGGPDGENAQRIMMVGVSGGGAELGDDEDRAKFQGKFVLLDADTGQQLKTTFVIPEDEWEDGYAGGGVWATPAIDPAEGYAYVGTGNPFQPQVQHERTNAILKVDVNPSRESFGEIVAHFQGTLDEYAEELSEAPCVDLPGNPPPYYPQGLGACMDQDLDFGASPNLFRDADGDMLVGEGQKSGEYHVVDAATMEHTYSTVVGPPTALGGIVGSTAVDDQRVYGPITVGGYLWGLEQDEGNLAWVSPVADGAHWGHATSTANGVVYTIDVPGTLRAYDAATGVPLYAAPQSSKVGANLGGGVSIARNTVYAVHSDRVIAHRPGGSSDGGEPPEAPELPALPEGQEAVVATQPGSVFTGYTPPVVPVSVSGSLMYTNADSLLHDVVASQDYGPDAEEWCAGYPAGRCPIVWSPLIGQNQTTPVLGVENLEPDREYPFKCSIHPGMRGTIKTVS